MTNLYVTGTYSTKTKKKDKKQNQAKKTKTKTNKRKQQTKLSLEIILESKRAGRGRAPSVKMYRSNWAGPKTKIS